MTSPRAVTPVSGVSDVRTAVVLATVPGAATVVGGLPLAVRAVLALRAAGFEDVAVVAPGDADRITGPLVRRGVGVRWLTTGTAAATHPPAERLLVLLGNVLVDADALEPLRRTTRLGAVGVSLDGRIRTIGAVGLAGDLAALRRDGRGGGGSCPPGAGTSPPLTLTTGLAVPLAGDAGCPRAPTPG